MDWVVKLTKHGGQYRVTLPRELVVKARLEDVDFVELDSVYPDWIMIKGYHGKEKEKRDLPENQA
jgi:hypothetical protein